ncbi:MAG: FixH family protein [Acetobacteraceae bacterium]|nr:FixH family protein [Acetobacteraceae bacterium]MDW8399610.1 FixH family protein [Acetobacteraceae bacterium]
MSDATGSRRSGWIPWVFVGGMGVVVAVNAVFVWLSLSTFTGTTVPRAFERGRQYDLVLAEAARQAALGWQVEVALAGTRLTVTARDSEGRPLTATVEGALHRPLQDLSVPVGFRAVGGGRWSGTPEIPLPGQWEARITLTAPDGARKEVRARLFVPPEAIGG